MTTHYGRVDRRQCKRYHVDWPIEIRAVNRMGLNVVLFGTLKNISARGALANITSSVQVGASVNLFVSLPLKSAKWMNLQGDVVRVDGMRDGDVVAMRFRSSRPDFVKILNHV